MVAARRPQSGFTAAEILVVLAIVGIIAVFAIPAMSKMLTTQAVRNAAYDLYADLVFARGEAIARGASVSIIATSSTNMKNGWIVREGTTNTLRTQAARTTAIDFTASANTVTFDKTGRVIVGGSPNWSIKPSDTSHTVEYAKRCIRLDPSGRPRTEEGKTCS